MADGHSEKYFDLFQPSSSDHKFIPKLVCGQDGSLRDTHLSFNLKEHFGTETSIEQNMKEGNLILVLKSNNPEAQFHLQTYSQIPSKIYEIFDVNKHILDTALNQSYFLRIHKDFTGENIDWVIDEEVKYGLKAYESGFGFGIFQNIS
jgi:hypothetical protein